MKTGQNAERKELIAELVFWSMSDDFENIDQIILPSVSPEASKSGFEVTRNDVVEALTRLVNDGMAKAYILDARATDPFSGELRGMPQVDTVEEDLRTYFYVTKRGLDYYNANRTWWPDEE